jgi:hypothetical protein
VRTLLEFLIKRLLLGFIFSKVQIEMLINTTFISSLPERRDIAVLVCLHTCNLVAILVLTRYVIQRLMSYVRSYSPN